MGNETQVVFRVISGLAGIGLVILGTQRTETGTQSWFVWLIALPLLVVPFLPKRWGAVFPASFLVGYTTILAAVLWLLTIASLPFSFERIGEISGPMAFAASLVWVISLVTLFQTPPAERGAIPGGIILGLLYFPLAYFGGLEYGRASVSTSKPSDLLRPVVCALEYHTSHGEWAPSWPLIAQMAGCSILRKNMVYDKTPSGFMIRTRGPQPQYYSDESGIIRRADTQIRYEQITNSEPASVGTFLFQLEEYRRKRGQYPESVEVLVAFVPAMRRIGEDNHYVFSYQRETPKRFALMAQPADYGVTGIRSFYTDQTHVVHATPFDRRATVDDPIAPPEEIRDLTPKT